MTQLVTRLTQSEKEEMLLLVSLFVFEVSLAVMAVASYMRGERSFDVFLPSRAGILFVCATMSILVAATVVIRQYLAHKRSPSPRFRLVVTMNLVTLLLIVVTGEIIVRAGSRSGPTGEAFLGIPMKPRSWDQAKGLIAKLLKDHDANRSVMVYDDRLGWTLGSNRYSPSKGEVPAYVSSVDGLRAPQPGVVFEKVEGKTDIALVGDSFTFGEKVSHEDTWGYKLNQLLGEDYRVLNFGVPGYSLDQAYRRYLKDTLPRNAKIVIFSFIDHDLSRTMRIYPFVFHDSWRLPFSKPRLVLQDGALREVNQTPAPPEEILSRNAISELPFIEYDASYKPSEWEKRWFHFSYLVRLIVSRFPAWSAARSEFSEAAMLSTNTEILRKFLRSAEQAGSIPIIMWFPQEGNIQDPSSYPPMSKRMLELAGIPYIDPTPCLLEVAPNDRFVGGHYSSQSNTAVTKCVYRAVEKALVEASGTVPSDHAISGSPPLPPQASSHKRQSRLNSVFDTEPQETPFQVSNSRQVH